MMAVDAGSDESQTASLLTVQAAAQRLALSRSMLYNLMERGDLAYVKIGRARRIPLSEVERLIRESLVSRRDGGVLIGGSFCS